MEGVTVERMTENRPGDTMLRQCFVCTEPPIAESCASCDHTCKAIMRLAEYEDTGLSPEVISDMVKMVEEIRTAKKEERLLVLPCAIGTPVYVHERLCVEGKRATFRVCKYAQDCMHDRFIKCPLRVVKRAFTYAMRRELGISFWLTPEEAEAAIPADRRP